MPIPSQIPAPGARAAPGTESLAAQTRFLTRRMLLDAEYRVVGHELGINPRVPIPVLPGATSAGQNRDEHLLASVIDERYRDAMGRKLCLLELHSLDSALVEHLPRENTILRVPAQPATPELLARCQSLVRSGFSLALDESGCVPGMAPLARQCAYLRLDVGDNDLMGLCDRLVRLRDLSGPRLIAANVDSHEAFAACRKLSFQLFQGDFLTLPRAVAAKSIDSSRLLIMRLLNLLTQHAEYAALAAEFKLDAGLSYKLLRYINSPAVGLRHPIRSIDHVLLMLGHDQLYRWLTLLLFSHGQADPRGGALLRQALVRARFAENLGERLMAVELRGGLFIAGILSLLDALLDLPMAQAIDGLRLAPAIADVLLRGEGPYGPYLEMAKACERGDQAGLGRIAGQLDLDAQSVNMAHLDALIWQEGLDL